MEFGETPGLYTKLPVSHVGLISLIITCLFSFLYSLKRVSVQCPQMLSSTQMLWHKETYMVDTLQPNESVWLWSPTDWATGQHSSLVTMAILSLSAFPTKTWKILDFSWSCFGRSDWHMTYIHTSYITKPSSPCSQCLPYILDCFMLILYAMPEFTMNLYVVLKLWTSRVKECFLWIVTT